MIKNIKTITIWPSEATQLYVGSVNVILGEGAVCYYQFQDVEGNILKDGNAALTPQQYSQWGSNDEYFIDCITANLGLEIA